MDMAKAKPVFKEVAFKTVYFWWGRPDLNRGQESPSLLQWDDFKTWLLNEHSKNTVDHLLRYARQYSYLLNDPAKMTDLHGLSRDKRRNVMAALANLSRFIGTYDQWQGAIKKAGLHWGKRSSLEAVISILEEDLSDVEAWLKKAADALPETYRTVIIFQALTGVRPTEACVSCFLISTKGLEGYYNAQLSMLEHFRYPDLFLRRSKNAYISFVPQDLLDHVLEVKPVVKYTAMISALRHRNLHIRLIELRKLYATTLREKGIPQEIIDILQGRVSQSIFLRHYYKPYLAEVRNKVFEASSSILEKIKV